MLTAILFANFYRNYSQLHILWFIVWIWLVLQNNAFAGCNMPYYDYYAHILVHRKGCHVKHYKKSLQIEHRNVWCGLFCQYGFSNPFSIYFQTHFEQMPKYKTVLTSKAKAFQKLARYSQESVDIEPLEEKLSNINQRFIVSV